jgi:hypothetical protein
MVEAMGIINPAIDMADPNISPTGGAGCPPAPDHELPYLISGATNTV